MLRWIETGGLKSWDLVSLMNQPDSNKILMVIPSVNGGELLARMLPTLRFPYANIIVLDQASNDDTAAICAAHDVQLVQLGRPHSYTEACNIGARIARERGVDYICVSNNDITFRTAVLDEMLTEMERDPRLGIVAPSQVIVDKNLDDRPVSYRVSWHLDNVEFAHQTTINGLLAERLDADFCELTCALVRMSAIAEIGFLDDEYGFYHEDADFGFRLGRAGYSCAYLPKSQIIHFLSSTINREKISAKAQYIARNKLYFAEKHLGYGINHRLNAPSLSEDWSLFTQEAHGYFRRYGLLDNEGPELMTSYPGVETTGYLYTPFQATELPIAWKGLQKRYRGVFTTSKEMQRVFEQGGIRYSFYVPPGIEPDLFNPWGLVRRGAGGRIFLAIVDRQYEQFLRILLNSWGRFVGRHPQARLILRGRDLGEILGRQADIAYQLGSVEIGEYAAEQITVQSIVTCVSDEDLAQLFRSVDFTIIRSNSSNPSLPTLQSWACGTPCIQVQTPSAMESLGTEMQEASLLVGGSIEALPDRLSATLAYCHDMSDHELHQLSISGFYTVRRGFTLRHTAMALYGALSHLQIRSPSRIIHRLKQQKPSLQPASTALTPEDIPAAPAAPPVVWTFRRRLSGLAARRIKVAGRLTADFGQVWQERGLRAAQQHLQADFVRIMQHRKLRRMPGASVAQDPAEAADIIVPPLLAGTTAFDATRPRSILLIGYIDAQLGLGQSLRGLAFSLSRTKLPFSIYPFGVGVEGRRSEPYMPERYDEIGLHAINVIEVGTNELPTVFANISPAHFRGSYNILRTYWELSRAPEAWRDHLRQIHEIWAPNPFIAESFRAIFDGPITVVPPCVDLPAVVLDGRAHFGLDAGRFYFLFSFDYFSFPQRKNPLAVLRAFRKAFPDLSENVGLVIKSTGAVDHFPALKQALRAAAEDDRRIMVIDESLTRQEMLGLLSGTDCYTSLHRAEGFGFGLTEAMALGKPVIGTDYSGNTEFLMPETGYPVPFELKPIGLDEYIYPESQVWAYPDEDACADAMRRVFTLPEEAKAKAEAGQRFVRNRYNPTNVGRIAEARAREILAQQAAEMANLEANNAG